MSQNNIDTALKELAKLDSPQVALAVLEKLEDKRKEAAFIRYWEATLSQKPLFDAFTPETKVFVIVGGNRCLAGDTIVPTPGGEKPIKDLFPGDLVYAIDGSAVPVIEKYENGLKHVYRWYAKKRGTEFYLDATPDHKVLTATQKDNVPKLKALDLVGSRSYLVRQDGFEFGKQEYPMALLIGLLLGDGYIAGAGVQWTCAEQNLVAILRPYIEGLGYKVHSWGIQHYISDPLTKPAPEHDASTGRFVDHKVHHRLRIELQRLGLLGTKSGTKFIPKEVWNWRKEDVAQLLAGLIATDGSVNKGVGTWHLSYTSKSGALIESFVKLLAEGFGIYGGTIRKGSKGTLQVTYGNRQALERLAKLPVPGRKGELLHQIVCGKDSKGTLVPLVDRESLGFLPTYDILVGHPSHTFVTGTMVSVANSGKSEIGAFISVAWALGKEFFKDEPAWQYVENLPIPDKKNNIWVVGLDFPVLRDVIWGEKLRFGRIHPSFVPKNPELIHKINDSDYQIFFENGSIITGKSADSKREKFQGASVDLVWIDEEPEEEIYNECFQRTVDCSGKILVTLTPLTDINSGVRAPWVYDLYEKMKEGQKDIVFRSLSVLDNPYVPDEEKERLKQKWAGHPEEDARLYGKFVQRSGLVYNTWDSRKHIVEPFEIPHNWRRIVSIDPSPTGVTAALWGAVDENNDLWLYREYYERNKIISDHAKNILLLAGTDLIDFWIIDPFFGRQRSAESHKTNIQLYVDAGVPVRLAPVSYEDYGLNLSREYISATVTPNSRQPKVFVFRDLGWFRWEIEHYSWATFGKGDQKGQSKEKPQKGRDHLMNCFQYMVSLRPKGKHRYVPSHEERALGAMLNSNV